MQNTVVVPFQYWLLVEYTTSHVHYLKENSIKVMLFSGVADQGGPGGPGPPKIGDL